ncbi:hypothetical protein B0O99DRAFT_681931 [Bisporella sp. PMI_857]|nr:hypothetical protein B0O99DRAFT_683058 [Bisporella sp. PMI_857]KAH8600242.1 hypothetical protein B0O99DRAFT_681931 [Bisporella sp. PMI_857]
MTFQTATSSTNIRFLALATLLVCIWFFVTIQGPNHYHPPPSGFSGHHRPPPKGKSNLMELLPMAEAKEYCAARRWEPYPIRQVHRKIYDLMLINTELEWLEVRMGQMNDHVDYFVIVEAAKTFTDADKPCTSERTGTDSENTTQDDLAHLGNGWCAV